MMLSCGRYVSSCCTRRPVVAAPTFSRSSPSPSPREPVVFKEQKLLWNRQQHRFFRSRVNDERRLWRSRTKSINSTCSCTGTNSTRLSTAPLQKAHAGARTDAATSSTSTVTASKRTPSLATIKRAVKIAIAKELKRAEAKFDADTNFQRNWMCLSVVMLWYTLSWGSPFTKKTWKKTDGSEQYLGI